MADTTKELVLVTGGSGFVGIHCIIQCLKAGYRVRSTIRTLKREHDVRNMLEAGEATNLGRLTFVEADLLKDEGWKDAVEGCTYVLHVASPFPAASPKHEDELIIPAREGTLRVLRASRDAGVKRVVVTSSFAAVGHHIHKPKEPFTEEIWTDVNSPNITTYQKSKTIAERAAWDFIKNEGGSLELSVINPVAILGPVFGPDFSISVQIVQRLLNGSVPGCPNLEFSITDVRDVADLHLRAMTSPKAAGERFLAVSPPSMTMREISLALRQRMGKAAKRSPTRTVPDFLLRLFALFDPGIALVVKDLGVHREISNEKAKKLLGWQPRSNVDAIIATAESLIKYGLVKPT